MSKAAVLAGLAAVALASAAAAEDWKFDRVFLKNGHVFDGLIADETKDAVHFKSVSRRPGAKTVVIETVFPRDEVARVERLDDVDRQELANRLDQLDRGGDKERARMATLPAIRGAWPGGGQGWQYAGKYFRFSTNVREDLFRRLAVRLEDLFQAYVEHLPTSQAPEEPTRIVLYRAVAEFRAAQLSLGLNLLNPALYDPKRNLILAGTDLEKAAEDLDHLRHKHEQMLQELDQHEKRLRKHYGGTPPAAMIAQLQQSRRSLLALNAENESAFERIQRPLFTMLAHEAFHAYLENYVYPSSTVTVPRWLNEGLAQIFETALVETGELRVGHVDPERLARVQEAIRKKQAVPLTDLLVSDVNQFKVAHQSAAFTSDRYFQASWALAYYLTFERKILGSPALDRYVRTLHRGTPPRDAFADLAGQPLSACEEQFHQYLLRLRPDGTLKP
jgi:hypothetical protein